MDDIHTPVTKIDGTPVLITDLDSTYDTWVHTGREMIVTKCSPDSEVAQQKLRSSLVYPITSHIRGRVILISNTGYQALRLLKDLFQQLQYKISIHTERSSEQVRAIIQEEASKEDNLHIDSFIIIIYGTPDGFEFGYLPKLLNKENAPNLAGKPKLLYVIGNDSIVQQVNEIAVENQDPDYLLASTGFNGVMFYIYILCKFVHELSAKDIWKLLMQFADRHRFKASCHCMLRKDFYFFPGLTTSVMPDDIQSMNPGDMELYLKMLEHGSLKSFNVRLMFVGLYGAGKTSTARRIMGRGIDDVSSTDGIDVYIGKCKVDVRDETWETVEDPKSSMPFTKLSRILLTDEDSEMRVPDIKNLEEAPLEEYQEMETDWEEVERLPGSSGGAYGAESHKKRRTSGSDRSVLSFRSDEQMTVDDSSLTSPPSVSTQSTSLSDFEMLDTMSKHNTDTMKTAHRVLQDARKKRGPQRKEALVSLWDFAGQFIYYATHQLFFSPRSVYLLVINLEEDLNKPLGEDWYMDMRGVEAIENQGGVMFWLRSIFTYARGIQPGIPPIILVGTHKDKLPGDDNQKRQTANKYFAKIRDAFKGTPLAPNIRKETFLLDNKNHDSEIEALKKKIIAVSKTLPHWGEYVPAKWIELEQALEDRRIDGRPFIRFKDLKEIDKNLARPINDDDQLRLFLRAHNENGTLVYFDDAKHLRDIIILDPQWIVHAFRYLICAEHFGQKYGVLQAHWEDFISSGQLDKELAEAIWQQDREHEFFQNHEILLYFLEKLDIIARAKIIERDGVTTTALPFYFVPCLVKKSPEDALLEMPARQDCINTPALCLTFRGNFLPPAVFNRVVAVCLGKWPIATQGKKKLIFCGCAIFELTHEKGMDRHRLTLFFRNSRIGIRITRYSSKGAKIVDQQLCDYVRRVVTSAVRKEFMRFQLKDRRNMEEPFEYMLQCKDTRISGYLEDGLHTLRDLESAIEEDYFCDRHTESFHPHHLSAVEMLQEWFNEKIPEGFRLEKLSTLDTWLGKLTESVKQDKMSSALLSKMANALGNHWEFLMLELGLSQVDIDHTCMNNQGRVSLQIYHCLRLWRDRNEDKATTGILLQTIKSRPDVTIDWDLIQNIIDGLE